MVTGNLFSRKELDSLSSEERKRYLSERLKIDEGELEGKLERIQGSKRLKNRVIPAAVFLSRRIDALLKDKIQKVKKEESLDPDYLESIGLKRILSLRSKEEKIKHLKSIKGTVKAKTINSYNLGAIVRDPENWNKVENKHVSTSIGNLFKEDLKELPTELREEITNTQLLREKVIDKEELPISSEKVKKKLKRWKGVEYGRNDWARGTRIPLEIKEDEANLLGIYWGDGSINNYPYSLFLKGNSKDFPFYEEVVSPLVRKVHSIDFPFYKEERPELAIGSKAVLTWINSLGFPKDKSSGFKCPVEYLDGQEEGFIEGFIASKGNLKTNRTMRFSSKEGSLLRSFKGLLNKINIDSNLYKSVDTNRLDISPVSLSKAVGEREIELINPKHQWVKEYWEKGLKGGNVLLNY